MTVVDTSVLVDFFRGRHTAATERLGRMEAEGTPFAIPAICCQELLQGAGGEQEWRLLLRYLETQTVLSPERPWPTHVAAARIFYDCRRKGLAVRSVVDCLIAQIALDADADLLHDDDDFDAIKQVRPLRAGRGGGDGRGSTAQRYGRGQSGRSSHSPKGRSVRSQ